MSEEAGKDDEGDAEDSELMQFFAAAYSPWMPDGSEITSADGTGHSEVGMPGRYDDETGTFHLFLRCGNSGAATHHSFRCSVGAEFRVGWSGTTDDDSAGLEQVNRDTVFI